MVGLNPKVEENILASTYWDLVTVIDKDQERVRDENGVTILRDRIKYENVKCAISHPKTSDRIVSDGSIGNIDQSSHLHMRPSYKLQENDVIKVLSLSGIECNDTYIVTRVTLYPSSVRCSLKRNERV